MSANKKPIMAAGAGIMGNMAYEDQLRQREEMEEQRAGRLRDKQKDYTGSVAAIRDNYADAGRDFRLGSLSASPNFNRKYYAKGGMAESDKNQIYQDIALSYLDAGREVPGSLSRYLPQNNKIAPAPRGYGSPFGGITNIWAMGQRNNQPSMPFGPNFGVMGGFNQYGPRYTGLEGLQGRNQNYKPQPFERIQDKSQGPRQMIANTDEILSGMSVPRGTPAQAPASAQPQGMVQPANQVLQQAGMNPATKKMAGGGDVDGPGDGMSDDIMTTIDGRDPAALSDGEFVIPADVVSHLGNGSSDAGAQRLYEMMARVRKARTGKEKQGKEINPRGMMPA